MLQLRSVVVLQQRVLSPLDIKELLALKMVQVGGKSYKLEFYLEGDLKFLLLFGGLPRPTLSIPAFGVWYHQVTVGTLPNCIQ
eukprot:Em0187g1a